MKCPRSLRLHGVQQRKRKHAAAAQATSNHTGQHKRKREGVKEEWSERGEEEGRTSSERAGQRRKREGKNGPQRKRPGREKEGRKEAEEGGGEPVEKDVTGWTEVTRNKRKKMVQIFVKVDGMNTVAMEVSPEDKVQKILNTVSGSDRDVYVMSDVRILRKSDKEELWGSRREHSAGHEQDARRRKTQGQKG